MSNFTESIIEDAALAWFESLGYAVKHGIEIAPGELAAERQDYGQVILEDRLRQSLYRLNPALPAEPPKTLSASSRAPKGRRWRRAIAPFIACLWMARRSSTA